MKTIILEGMLGDRYGREWSLDVKTPSEAMRAIDANKPGFIRYIFDSDKDGVGYQVIIGGREISEEDIKNELHFPFSDREEFILTPVISGAGSGGPIKFVIAAILLVVAVVLAAPTGGGSTMLWGETVGGIGFLTAGNIALVGVMMMASGIAAMMAPDPPSVDSDTGNNKASYLFNGPINTIAQGGPVPIGYGRLIIGSVLISGGIVTQELMLAEELSDYETSGDQK